MRLRLGHILITLPFLILLIITDSSSAQTQFKEYLGEKKSYALDQLILFFDEEIAKHNIGDYETSTIIREFVKSAEVYAPYFNNDFLQVDSTKAHHILQLYESTGLRKEIWLYDSREYTGQETIDYYHKVQDSLSIIFNYTTLPKLSIIEDYTPDTLEYSTESGFDQNRKISRYSNLVEALYKCCNENNFIKDYCETKIIADYYSSPILVSEILDSDYKIDLDDYFVKVVIVTEFYYHFLYYSIFKKTAPNNGEHP